MGRLIVLLAIAGAAVVVARPGSTSRTHSSVPAVAAAAPSSQSEDPLAAARRDFEKRQAEVGLVGSAPLFGAEGLPKPAR